MKIITALAVAQLFLLVRGSEEVGEPKRVGCFYMGAETEPNVTLYPEEIDTSICSHLMYVQGVINNETGELKLKPVHPAWKMEGEDFVARLVSLKAVNPDLKLTLLSGSQDMESLIEPSRRTNIIKNVVKWLNETGFDGLDFPFFMTPLFRDKMADFLCDVKSEFDKHRYMLTALLTYRVNPDPIPGEEHTISKLARCCDYVSLILETRMVETNYMVPIKNIISNVDWFIERGLPANKIKIAIPSYGHYVRLQDPKETGIGAKIFGPAIDYSEFGGGIDMGYKRLIRELNNSSMGWTIRRDEETKEVYAFTKTGLWATYEDPESLSFKARYVLQKGLGGMVIVPVDMDDDEGTGGEGRFPLTRAIYNIFRRQNHSADITQ